MRGKPIRCPYCDTVFLHSGKPELQVCPGCGSKLLVGDNPGMKTDVDTALKDIADWYIENKREISEPELESILWKHCESKEEIQKFVKFLETEPGQLRFKTLLRERKAGGTEEWKIRVSIADTVYGLQHGVKEEDIRKNLTRNPKAKYWYEPQEVENIIREAKKQLLERSNNPWKL